MFGSGCPFAAAGKDKVSYLDTRVFENILDETPRTVQVSFPEEAFLTGKSGQQHLSAVA